jgi:hypothetical protein
MSSNEKLKAEYVKRNMAVFQKQMEDARAGVKAELEPFLVSLGMEGERSAVVLGAERINVSLEALLKAFLKPPISEKDTLFASEGALATFSRKIEMAYRLGLIDRPFKNALNLVRRLRNDFAHAVKVESLKDQQHANKVVELLKLVAKGNEQSVRSFQLVFQIKHTSAETQKYLSCIMLLLMKLELVRYHMKPADVLLPAKLDYKEQES